MQVVMLQKHDLEKLRRTLGLLRAQKEQLRAQVKQSRDAQAFAYQVGETMDGEVEASAAELGEREEENGGAGFEEQKEPVAASSSQKAGRRSGPAGSSRPTQLEVDTVSAGDTSRQIRALIPFSPPVGPVSPWGAASPAASTRPHSSAAGLVSLSSSPYAAAAPRGHGMAMHVPSPHHGHGHHHAHHSASKAAALAASEVQRPSTSAGIVTQSHTQSQHGSPYSSYPSRAQSAIPTSAPPKSAGSAASSRMSPGAALLAASLAQSQTPQPITTSSQSYASTTVYAPGVHFYTPGPYAHVHAASRNAEKMYSPAAAASAVPSADSPNAAVVSRPRTSSGPSSSSSRAASTSARIINPLLSAGLVPASSVAAAMTQQRGLALHPSLQLTGDVRYDIISPYVAAPLPWEKKAATVAGGHASTAHAPASPATRDSTSASAAREAIERRRKATQYGNAVTERHAAHKTAHQHAVQQLHMQETAFDERSAEQQQQQKEQEQQEQRDREQQQQAAFESIIHADAPVRPGSSSARTAAGRPSSATRMRPSHADPIPPAVPISPASSRPLSSHSNSATAAASGNNSANSSQPMSPRGGGPGGVPAKKSPIHAPPPSGSSVNFAPQHPNQSQHAQQQQQQGLLVPTPTPPPSRPGAPSPQSSAVPSTATSPAADYRSLRTGGAIGQRPHAAAAAHSVAAQRVSLNGAASSRHEYEDDPFDRSRSQSSMRPSVAAPTGAKAAAAVAPDDDYSDDDDIRQDDLRRDDSNYH